MLVEVIEILSVVALKEPCHNTNAQHLFKGDVEHSLLKLA